MTTTETTNTAIANFLTSDLAPTLCRQIRTIHDQNMAIATTQTRDAAKALIMASVAKMPEIGDISVDEMESLVTELLPPID